MTTYTIIMVLFCAPLAVTVFAKTFMIDPIQAENDNSTRTQIISSIHGFGVVSPFAAAFSVPLTEDELTSGQGPGGFNDRYFPDNWLMPFAYVCVSLGLNAKLFGIMIFMLNTRWRVSQSSGGNAPPQVEQVAEVATVVQ